MGCDIHAHAEIRKDGTWHRVEEAIFPGYNKPTTEPFTNRSYSKFAFLAGVRNYGEVPCISGEPKGLPEGAGITEDERSFYEGDGHSASWLTLKELLDYNYDQQIEDRRVTRQTGPRSWSGGCTAEPGGGGKMMTLREYLSGDDFFPTIEALKTLGQPEDVRVVFWFDN